MVLQAIAKETGLAVGQLKDFAAEGGITSDIVLRALKRIENEGADQLAQAMDTPQQAIKDLQNAAEDLNVEVGRLVQPAVLDFVRQLTGLMRDATTQMEKAGKAAQYLTSLLKPLVDLGYRIAGAFDAMGISVNTASDELLKSLPGVGQAIRAYETLANVMGWAAQQQDNSKGGRNFGSNYAAQERALFEQAGGWSPYGNGPGLSGNLNGGSGGGKGKGGGSSAADEAARMAEKMADQLLNAEKLVTAAERRISVIKAVTEEEKIQAESMNRMLEIAEKYGELATDSLSEEERIRLLKAQGLEIEYERLSKLKSSLLTFKNNASAVLTLKSSGCKPFLLVQKSMNYAKRLQS